MKQIRRISGMFLVEVEKANGNGEGNDGTPRLDDENFGLILPPSLKRKFLDLFEDHESPAFVEIMDRLKNLNVNPDTLWILNSVEKGFKCGEGDPGTRAMRAKEFVKKIPLNELCSRYYDMRVVGSGAAEEKKNEDDKKKGNGGFKCFKTGVITMSPLRSVCPVEVQSFEGSRKVSWRSDVLEGGTTTDRGMAYTYVKHGLYVGTFTINPAYAHRTMTTDLDIEIFKRTIPFVYSANESATRPGGSVRFVHIWFAEHEGVLQTFDEQGFWNALMPKRLGDNSNLPSTSLADYDIPTKVVGVNLIDLNECFSAVKKP